MGKCTGYDKSVFPAVDIFEFSYICHICVIVYLLQRKTYDRLKSLPTNAQNKNKYEIPSQTPLKMETNIPKKNISDRSGGVTDHMNWVYMSWNRNCTVSSNKGRL